MIGNIDLRLYILIVITLSLAAYVNSLKRLFNGEIKKSFLNVGLGIFYNALVLMIMTTDNLNESSLLLLSVVPNMILITNLIFGFLPTIITLTIMPLIFINNITQFIYFIPSILVFLFSTLLNNIRSKGYLNNRTACLVFIYSFNIMMFVYFAATYYSWVIDINAYLSLLLVLPLTSFGTILMVDFINNKNLTANNMKIEYDMLMLSLNSTLDLQVKILDKDYRYIETNDAHINKMKEIYGTDVKIGDSYLDKILNEIDRENIKDSIDKAFKGSIFEWIYQNKAGQVLKTYYSPLVTNKNEQAVVLFTQDITDEKIREQEIYKLTFVDALTNTYNRHYFSKNFDRYNNEEQLVLLYFDVNMLKVINDAFGHNCGDDLLVFVTEALKANFKTNSEIIRMGGDEFIVIINDHPLHLVEEELSKFNEMIRNNQVLGIDISISVGLSVKDKNQEFENVLKAAEEKMYKDKFFTLESRGQRFLDNIYNRLVKEKVINSKLILLQQNYALKTYNRFNSNYEDVQIINSLVKYYSLGKISKSSDSNYFIEVSYRLLSAIPKYKGIANYMRRVLENYDGSGYPGKIKGDKIPVLSQIINIINYFGEDLFNTNHVLKVLPTLKNKIVSAEIIDEFMKVLKGELYGEEN